MGHLIKSWPIVVGCEKLTEGCDNCPSYKSAIEHKGIKGHIFEKGYSPYVLDGQINLPYSQLKQTIFHVALGSDIFHESIDGLALQDIFEVMNENSRHKFIVTTKRAERMFTATRHFNLTWSDNILAAVSVESFAYKWRIDYLRQLNCNNKLLFLMPLLGPIGILNLNGIHSVTVSQETWGDKKFYESWALEVKKQCEEQNVLYFFEDKPQVWESD